LKKEEFMTFSDLLNILALATLLTGIIFIFIYFIIKK